MTPMVCNGCQGRKNILSLGNIYKKCATCDGKGFVDSVYIETEKVKELKEHKEEHASSQEETKAAKKARKAK